MHQEINKSRHHENVFWPVESPMYHPRKMHLEQGKICLMLMKEHVHRGALLSSDSDFFLR